MNDLNLIAQIDEKIQQLSPEAAIKVNEYIDSLLQTYRKQSETQLDSLDEWTKSLVGLIPEDKSLTIHQKLATLANGWEGEELQLGVSGEQFSQFSGLIENSELLLMSEAIEADCRRVEIHEG